MHSQANDTATSQVQGLVTSQVSCDATGLTRSPDSLGQDQVQCNMFLEGKKVHDQKQTLEQFVQALQNYRDRITSDIWDYRR